MMLGTDRDWLVRYLDQARDALLHASEGAIPFAGDDGLRERARQLRELALSTERHLISADERAR